MKENFILNSLLDNDFYKFTMQNAVIKLFPYAKVHYKFINRGKHSFCKGFAKALEEEIKGMQNLKLNQDEKVFLENNCPYLDPTYIDFLKGYQYNAKEVEIIQKETQIEVSIKGYWYRTILWEVPLLALISELYYKLNPTLKKADDKELINKTKKKVDFYKEIPAHVAEFGTRRRHSYKVHELVVKTLKNHSQDIFVGTSNVHFSQKFNLKPIGTHSHEWFMFHGAAYGFKIATKLALENWANVYGGDLGIALSDTYTTKVFFENFDKKLAKLFDGVRHDSGDPIFFAQNTIKHYENLKINPLTKSIIFSDSLTPPKVKNIAEYCKNKIITSFGVGTDFTNDVGLKPLNIVIKMDKVSPFKEEEKWISVIKISDEQNKLSGDSKMINLAKKYLEIN
jgi:nicotinate phosphoribosyltransferase